MLERYKSQHLQNVFLDCKEGTKNQNIIFQPDLMINTLIVNNDQEGTGNTEEAGADKDDHRDEQHEHEVGVRRLTDV